VTNKLPPALRFVQSLIERLAPPLHSLHWKVFVLVLIGSFVPAIYFLWQLRASIERSHLATTEAGMIDTAMALAASHPSQVTSNSLSQLLSRTFPGDTLNLRVLQYDQSGGLVHDSESALPLGIDWSANSDVARALSGNYGARWEHNKEQNIVELFVTVPEVVNGQIVGALSTVKATRAVKRSVIDSLRQLAAPLALSFLIAGLISYLLSSYLTAIIRELAKRAARIAAGEKGVSLETWTRSELGDLARALDEMRERLEGRSYVEDMASTLTHELKTPLAAIRGASEILETADDRAVRSKFSTMIQSEADRLTKLVRSMLELSRIDYSQATQGTTSAPALLLAEDLEQWAQRAEACGVSLNIEVVAPKFPLPPEDLRRVMGILLENAIAYTPSGQEIRLSMKGAEMTVSDQGQGIDQAVVSRVTERFFSTVNPRTGQRGSGLGLAIASAITKRSGGTLTIHSSAGRGTTATLRFPVSLEEP